MHFVDTNVISTGTPERAALHACLSRWMDEQSGRLHLSAVTVAEIDEGIAKALRLGSTGRAAALSGGLEAVLHLYGDRILPLDTAVARAAGRLSDQATGIRQAPGFPDVAIAATAAVHGLSVLTRNTRRFVSLGVSEHDPFMSLPK
jgi:toxin FitB